MYLIIIRSVNCEIHIGVVFSWYWNSENLILLRFDTSSIHRHMFHVCVLTCNFFLYCTFAAIIFCIFHLLELSSGNARGVLSVCRLGFHFQVMFGFKCHWTYLLDIGIFCTPILTKRLICAMSRSARDEKSAKLSNWSRKLKCKRNTCNTRSSTLISETWPYLYIYSFLDIWRLPHNLSHVVCTL